MARYTESVCRLCRREKEKLFLKGDRCYTEKCSVEKRKYPPGQHGQKRGKLSDYALQLREKQKVKHMYGVLEGQFRNYYEAAKKKKGITGEVLLDFLERRLDNVVFRMGFAANRRQARQFVGHALFAVNGKTVNIPSYLVRAGDVVEVREQARKMKSIEDNLAKAAHRGSPVWIEVDGANFKGTFSRIPSKEEIALPVQEQLIIELYSK